ncbi:MAG TPA: invasion associated locus B family protein [Hyphomicrobiaceae bacterium]|nr:invasion associated locus B family protein [Hyphomicrobiaceae bacterium]
MTRLPIILAGTLVTLSILAATSATAQTKLVQAYRDWTMYAHSGSPADICFITSQPKEATPAGTRGDRSFFYISAWPKDGIKAEISVKVGSPLKDSSPVIVQIGNQKFELFTKGDKAFVSDATEELKLLDAMKRGSFMVTKATRQDGQETTETYSLLGVTQAINSLAKGCG